ncbi:MAG: DUF3679 domain-containing protein [Bacilli bacterium]
MRLRSVTIFIIFQLLLLLGVVGGMQLASQGMKSVSGSTVVETKATVIQPQTIQNQAQQTYAEVTHLSIIEKIAQGIGAAIEGMVKGLFGVIDALLSKVLS